MSCRPKTNCLKGNHSFSYFFSFFLKNFIDQRLYKLSTFCILWVINTVFDLHLNVQFIIFVRKTHFDYFCIHARRIFIMCFRYSVSRTFLLSQNLPNANWLWLTKNSKLLALKLNRRKRMYMLHDNLSYAECSIFAFFCFKVSFSRNKCSAQSVPDVPIP